MTKTPVTRPAKRARQGRKSSSLRVAGLVALVVAASQLGVVSLAPANHIPGATYTGTHSGGGTIEFTLSADGTRVTGWKLTNVPCTSGCTSIDTETSGGSGVPITNHAFSYQSSTESFQGSFPASQSASGSYRAFGGGIETATVTWRATTTAPPPPSSDGADRCVVPRVKGKRLRVARRAIVKAGCRTGTVRRAYSARVRAGRVISQTPRPGAQRHKGAKVNLVVSKGKRRT